VDCEVSRSRREQKTRADRVTGKVYNHSKRMKEERPELRWIVSEHAATELSLAA